MFLHKSHEGLYEYFSKEMLPKDYGGEEKSFDELTGNEHITFKKNKCWNVGFLELTQKHMEAHKERLERLGKLRTNESLRPGKPINDEFFGFYGNFKKLQVDWADLTVFPLRSINKV